MQKCAFSRSDGHLRSLYRPITFGQCHANTELHNPETHAKKRVVRMQHVRTLKTLCICKLSQCT